MPKDSADMIDTNEKTANYKRMMNELSHNGEFEINDLIYVSACKGRIHAMNIQLRMVELCLTKRGRSSQ